MRKPLTPSELKAFRSKVSTLKKAGLVWNIDARRATPSTIRQGHVLADTIKKYDDVISGKVTPVSLPPEKIKAYRAAKYSTTKVSGKTFVLVPHSATEKVKVSKEGEVEIVHPSGFRKIKQMVPYKSIPQWLQDFKRSHKKIDATKSSQMRFAYTFYGNAGAASTFESAEHLAEALIEGSVSGLNLMEKAREATHKQQNEYYRELNIFIVPRPHMTPEPAGRRSGRRSAAARKKWRKKIANTEKGERMRKQAREREAKKRASLSRKELDKLLAKNRKAVRKWRKNHPNG
jgi:hypothetical protein